MKITAIVLLLLMGAVHIGASLHRSDHSPAPHSHEEEPCLLDECFFQPVHEASLPVLAITKAEDTSTDHGFNKSIRVSFILAGYISRAPPLILLS